MTPVRFKTMAASVDHDMATMHLQSDSNKRERGLPLEDERQQTRLPHELQHDSVIRRKTKRQKRFSQSFFRKALIEGQKQTSEGQRRRLEEIRRK